MEISAPIKEAFMGPSSSMEPGIPSPGADPVVSMDDSHCSPEASVEASSHWSPEAFVEASASDTEVFTKLSASLEAQKAVSCEGHDTGIFGKSARTSREPLMMSKEGEELAVYYRKGRTIRQIESKKRTFDRRCSRLLKKAYELSVLCDAEVGAIVFSPSGKISEFASSSTSHIIKRYQSFQPQMPVLLQDERWKHDANLMMNKKLKYLQEFQRCLFEKNNISLTISEVKSSETMLEDALTIIRKRKSDLLEDEAQKIIEKVGYLTRK